MPMFHVSVQHGRTTDDARARLELAVNEVKGRFGQVVQRVDWSADRNTVTIAGAGVVIEMRVDPSEVHVSGDVPIIASLLGKPLEAGVKQIVQKAFGKG